MNDQSQKTPMRVAVLRGGATNHASSIAGGYSMLDSLAKLSIDSLDIYIDEMGVWYSKGIPVEPHAVFSLVDGYIDTTETLSEKYKDLARRMGVKKLLFDFGNEYHTDRENVYRILRQKGVLVPETKVIRTTRDILASDLRAMWNYFHIPLLLRPLSKEVRHKSALVRTFDGLTDAVREYAEKGIDFHVLTYRGVPTISTALLPNYRGEKVYMPLSVTTLVDTNEVPNESSKIVVYRTHEKEYAELKSLLTKVYEMLMLKDPVLIDVIKTPQGFMVVEVETKPSLKEGSRFMQSLKSTGVELAHYIMESFPDPQELDAKMRAYEQSRS